MNVLGMGPLELVLVAALTLVVFGPGKLPEIARQVAGVVREIRRVSSEVTEEFRQGFSLDEPPARRAGPRAPVAPPAPVTPGRPDDLRPPY